MMILRRLCGVSEPGLAACKAIPNPSAPIIPGGTILNPLRVKESFKKLTLVS